jgi:hypothetical protein
MLDDEARVHVACSERRVVQDELVVTGSGRHAGDDGLIQRTQHSVNRLQPVSDKVGDTHGVWVLGRGAAVRGTRRPSSHNGGQQTMGGRCFPVSSCHAVPPKSKRNGEQHERRIESW